jgi:Chitin binding Peritrophin-A domain.
MYFVYCDLFPADRKVAVSVKGMCSISPPCPCSQAKRWEDFPNLTFTFDCSDRAVGFYADTEHHCQIFHMCDEDGRRIPYICANDTSFNQEFRVCDWEYNFDCSQAPQWSVFHHRQYKLRSYYSVIREMYITTGQQNLGV